MRCQEKERLDEELKCLAIVAQRHPPLSMERKQALTKLVCAILRSGELWRSRGNNSQFYLDAHADAVQELLLYICENIEEYDPERGFFIEWVVMLLSKRFLNKVTSPAKNKHLKNFPTMSGLDDFLENISLPEEKPSLLEKLRECIELDPDNVFKNHCLKNNSSVNFQILIRRRLAGETWRVISSDLGVEISTLSSFYERSLAKLGGKLKKYLAE